MTCLTNCVKLFYVVYILTLNLHDMKPKKQIKNKCKNPNIQKKAYLQYRLALKGYTMRNIADDLGISLVAVSRSFSDLSTITRVDEWLKRCI